MCQTHHLIYFSMCTPSSHMDVSFSRSLKYSGWRVHPRKEQPPVSCHLYFLYHILIPSSTFAVFTKATGIGFVDRQFIMEDRLTGKTVWYKSLWADGLQPKVWIISECRVEEKVVLSNLQVAAQGAERYSEDEGKVVISHVKKIAWELTLRFISVIKNIWF